MKQLLSNLCLAAVLAFTGVGAAQAGGEITFTYGAATHAAGTGGKKAETVDLAMLLRDEALVGLQVKAVRIPFASAEGLSNARAWLSVALPAIKSSKAGEPDVCSKAFDIADGYTEITFDEPYTLTSEGVYVGYSFDMAAAEGDVARKPIPVTGYTSPGAFLIHSTKIYRTAWQDRYPYEGQLCLEVILAGDAVKTNAAGITPLKEQNVQTGLPTDITFEVANHGTAGISSLDYSVSINGEKRLDSCHADLNVEGIFGATATVELTLPAMPQKGVYTYAISIDKVNGQANEETAAATAALNVYNTLAIHRAVLEEYTGTWCGYCPRGFVGLEEMNRLYPNDFIGISYHNDDPMEVTTAYPNNVAGFPDAWLDRWYQTDAFCGDENYGVFGIDKAWKYCCDIFTPAAVEVSSQWTDDNTLKATAAVTFIQDAEECPYTVGFVLTANGLKGESSDWSQSNYYGGDTGWPASMSQFTQGSSHVDGLTFNDVLIECSSNRGIDGSLTAPIEEDVAQTVDFDFDLSAIKAQLIPADRSKLHVVALLIDTRNGHIINANKAAAGHASTAALGTLTADQVVDRVGYYDLQGRRVSLPRHGLFLRTETLRDGSVRTQKVQF